MFGVIRGKLAHHVVYELLAILIAAPFYNRVGDLIANDLLDRKDRIQSVVRGYERDNRKNCSTIRLKLVDRIRDELLILLLPRPPIAERGFHGILWKRRWCRLLCREGHLLSSYVFDFRTCTFDCQTKNVTMEGMEQISATSFSTLGTDGRSLEGVVGRFALEIAESAVLSCFEPKPISSWYDDELPRARQAILRARDGNLARFRNPVNRNAFLVACRDYADQKPEEHLIVGYGFRHGSTTKVESLHHVVGETDTVHLPNNVAHAMWDFYEQHESNELLVFHNHPYNPLNFLLDNWPLTSRQDRLFLQARGLNPPQLVRRLLGQGRILFYLGENGNVKEFRLPSVVALLGRFCGGGRTAT